MSYYHTCNICGANLDPGETCDCQKDNNENTEKLEPDKDESDIISTIKKLS